MDITIHTTLPPARRPGRLAGLLPRHPRLRGPQRRRPGQDALDHGRPAGPARHLHRAAPAGRRPRHHRRRAPHHRRDDGQGHLRLRSCWPPTTSTAPSSGVQASDAEVVQEPTEQPYGVRDCAFRDPAGNLIRIQRAALSRRADLAARDRRRVIPGNLAAPTTPHEPLRPTDGDPMSMATRTEHAVRPTPHVADSHDLIRVQGARENNLKDVSVEIPKRRLTVFTGVSGSGKSSLVFGTIAAESQRMINETYSAFVQGFMPTLARPDVDRARGPDDRDHRRPGADGRQPALHGRHRHRRQRDAADPVQPARRRRTSARRRRSPSTSRPARRAA